VRKDIFEKMVWPADLLLSTRLLLGFCGTIAVRIILKGLFLILITITSILLFASQARPCPAIHRL